MAGARRRYRGRRGAHEGAWFWPLLLLAGIAATIAGGMLRPWSPGSPPADMVPPLSAQAARRSNAAVPIERSRRLLPVRFRFTGSPAAREQAAQCLATAALYEVGSDPRGQRAVIQVVLNRVRAPGFPRTVCGVVYQGSTRPTGCQFSFTCDRSFVRRPIRAGWGAARRLALRALAGAVYPPVGRATHYHADWMVPYWRDSMVKVARVGPHLFYVRG